ncbi:MAG: glycogen synthase GlgA [Gammaproteobacteria bacterium]|nr:glycogen synthase GlgA [Gammaproteobacteria bacterium]
MRVLYVSTELHPALKTGGLADVNAGLPPALRAQGADVRLLLPAFPALRAAAQAPRRRIALGAMLGCPDVGLLPCRLGAVPTWLIDAPAYYDRPGNPYLDASGADWPDNPLRFALLGAVAARFADGGIGRWRPHVVHGHDWHAGLAPAYLAARGGARPASVFTVHNLSYQGHFAAESFDDLGLPAHFFAIDGVEYHGGVNFMKAGLHFADRITTVSPTYAAEIQTADYGCGMEGVLHARAGALLGILNGIDTRVWDPAQDPALAAPFTRAAPAGKRACRAALLAAAGLAGDAAGPVLGVVSRLTAQKGLDLLRAAVAPLLAADGRVVLLGSGDAGEEAAWQALARAHPGTVAVRVGYDETYAHRIFAGADAVAVPSRFEPCGLTQMYAMLYGALPLVRRTGGLADTVSDGPDGTGFVFDAAELPALQAALARLLQSWAEPARWQAMQARAMGADFGWARAARRYLALYRELRPQADPPPTPA